MCRNSLESKEFRIILQIKLFEFIMNQIIFVNEQKYGNYLGRKTLYRVQKSRTFK